MITSEKTDALMPALLEAKRAMSPVHKGKKNTHFNYSYANEEAWHDAIQPALLEQGLILTFSVDDCRRAGTLTTVEACARVTHAASGQWMQINGVGEGDDKADKAAYKAMTGAKKYLYALAFSLPTTDDVEDPQHDKRRAADEVKAKAKAEQPDATQAEINSKLVAEGHAPEHNKADRETARALFEVAKLLDYAEANKIKRNHGTDYAAMAIGLQAFIDIKKATT